MSESPVKEQTIFKLPDSMKPNELDQCCEPNVENQEPGGRTQKNGMRWGCRLRADGSHILKDSYRNKTQVAREAGREDSNKRRGMNEARCCE